MSSPPATHEQRSSSPTVSSERQVSEQNRNRNTLERVTPTLAKPIRITSFWAAIVLPFLHVPLLATGLTDSAQTITFLGLLVLNLVALYVGHSHRN